LPDAFNAERLPHKNPRGLPHFGRSHGIDQKVHQAIRKRLRIAKGHQKARFTINNLVA
jgi:hypothetical protein